MSPDQPVFALTPQPWHLRSHHARSRLDPAGWPRNSAKGMGEVWLAEQHQPVRRKVAVKIIKLGMDTREIVARFAAEQQALALMDVRASPASSMPARRRRAAAC